MTEQKEMKEAIKKLEKQIYTSYGDKNKCEHDWVKITNIEKQKVWYMIFVYLNGYERKEKFVCLKCGEERR